MSKKNRPKVLLLDIETMANKGFFWDIWEQNIGLEQIIENWSILSWAAKWEDSKVIMYQDVSKQKDLRDDKAILKTIWNLLDSADVVVTQNGVKFDIKKLNARFIYHGMIPPSSFKHFDTLKTARKFFSFTSNSLEALCNFLGTKHKKLKHKKFPGFTLWKECFNGNKEAWTEMKLYNKNDILALQGVYEKLRPWDSAIDFSIYNESGKEDNFLCKCGSTSRIKYGFAYLKSNKYQRFRCSGCSAESRGKKAIKNEKK